MHINKGPRDLQINFHLFCGRSQACSSKITHFKYLGNDLSSCFDLLQVHFHILGYPKPGMSGHSQGEPKLKFFIFTIMICAVGFMAANKGPLKLLISCHTLGL